MILNLNGLLCSLLCSLITKVFLHYEFWTIHFIVLGKRLFTLCHFPKLLSELPIYVIIILIIVIQELKTIVVFSSTTVPKYIDRILIVFIWFNFLSCRLLLLCCLNFFLKSHLRCFNINYSVNSFPFIFKLEIIVLFIILLAHLLI